MLIGITGGIGSGKSTIARALEELGYPVYYTDREAKRLIVSSAAVRSAIESTFGKDVYDGDTYLTQRVAEQVFRDRSLLERLNEIVHPAVAADLQQWYQSQSKDLQFYSFTNSSFCFVECAILIESGMADLCDRVVNVTAPLDVRIARTIARDGATPEAVRSRINAQLPDDVRSSRASIILNNDGITPVPDLVRLLLSQL